MKKKTKVRGIGGILFRAKDPENLRKWYEDKLGFITDEYGSIFEWRTCDGRKAYSVWSPFPNDTKYFTKEFMITFRVDDLEGLLEELRSNGVNVSDHIDVFDYGKFGWITDPEGNRIELWEPNDENYSSIAGDRAIK